MPRARNDSEAPDGEDASASVGEDHQSGDRGRLERVALPEAPVSRVIEYFPPGESIIARDCKYAGLPYSKGDVIRQQDGNTYECSGDKDGTWVKKSK